MRKLLIGAAAWSMLACGAAHANSVVDPTGDFLPSYVGPQDPDLDVTFFSVTFDDVARAFDFDASLAGPIDPSKAGLYVIGVNTGTGTIRPFAGIGEPNVIFNQAIVIQKTGAATLGPNALTASISGDSFSLVVPLSMLPSTGFAPQHYGFNLWPRDGLGNNNQISDFAPQNALLSTAPEPAAWLVMLTGFGLLGGAVRLRRRPMAA